MSAREMFEELGYEYFEAKEKGLIWYERELPVSFTSYITQIISFNFQFETVQFYSKYKSGAVSQTTIFVSELKAINKQIEELGWNK